MRGSGRIRELYRAICEFPGKPIEIELRGEKLKQNGNFSGEVRRRIVLIKLTNWALIDLRLNQRVRTYQEGKRENFGKRYAWYEGRNSEQGNI